MGVPLWAEPARRAALLGLALSVLAAGACPCPAKAQGLNLGWTSCGATAPADLEVACDRSDGHQTLVGSFRAPFGVPRLVGFEAMLQVCFPNGSIPDWWRMFEAGDCRWGSASTNFAAPPGDCVDYLASVGGVAGFTVHYLQPYHGAPVFYLWLDAEVDSSSAGPIVAGTEYFLFNLVIDNAKTSGSSTCSGCDQPAIITFFNLELRRIGDYPIGFGYSDRRSWASWQGPSHACAPVPVKRRTWGTLKSPYR